MKDYFRLVKRLNGMWFILINALFTISINFSDIGTEKVFSLLISNLESTQYLLWFICFSVSYVLLLRFGKKLKQKNQQKLTRKVQQEMYKHVVELPLREQTELEFGKLTNSIVESDKIMSHCFEVPEFMLDTICSFGFSMILILFFIYVIFFCSL